MSSIDGLSGSPPIITIVSPTGPELELINESTSGSIKYTNSDQKLTLRANTRSVALDGLQNRFTPTTNLLMDLGSSSLQWANIFAGAMAASTLASGPRFHSTGSVGVQNAASPAISHVSDAKTGMYYELDVNNTLSFASNGIKKCNVDINGFNINSVLRFPDSSTNGNITYSDSTKTLKLESNGTGIDLESGVNVALHPTADISMALGLDTKRFTAAFLRSGVFTYETVSPVVSNFNDQDTGIVLPANDTMIVKAANTNSATFSANGITSTVQPFALFRNTTTQTTTNNISGSVLFPTTIQSQGSTISNSSGTFTVSVAGIYYIGYKVHVATASGTGARLAQIQTSNLPSSGLGRNTIPGNAATSLTMSGSCVVKLSANDTFNVIFFQNSGGNITIGDGASNQIMNELYVLKIY